MSTKFRFSATSTFLDCRRRFMLEYVYELEKVKISDYVSAADIGTAVHEGLAAYYKGGDARATILSASSGFSYQKAKEQAIGSIERYLRWVQGSRADEGLTPVLVEERLTARLNDDVDITGQPDLFQEDEFGNLHGVDHKSVASFEKLAGLPQIRQGMTYDFLARKVLGRQLETFTLNMIKRDIPKTNPISVDRLTVWVTDAMRDSFESQLNEVTSDMLLLTDYVNNGKLEKAYPSPSSDCSWKCPFYNVCPVMDTEPERAKELLQIHYRKREPLA